MARQSVGKNNYTAGEVSPFIVGRSDTTKYANGSKILKNAFVKPQGGVTRRPGTVHGAVLPSSSQAIRMIPFRFSTLKSYLLTLRDQSAWIWEDVLAETLTGGPLTITYLTYEITNYVTGDNFLNVGAASNATGVTFEATGPNPTVWSNGSTLVGRGMVLRATLTLPYLEAENDAIDFTQSADVLFLTHPNHKQRTITRTSDTAWTTEELDTINGPYLNEVKDIDLQLAAVLPDTVGSACVTDGSTPAVVTPDGGIDHTLITGDRVIMSGADNESRYRITRLTDKTFSLQDDETGADVDGTGLVFVRWDWLHESALATASKVNQFESTDLSTDYFEAKDTPTSDWKLGRLIYSPNSSTQTAWFDSLSVRQKEEPEGTSIKSFAGSKNDLKSNVSGTFVNGSVGTYVRIDDDENNDPRENGQKRWFKVDRLDKDETSKAHSTDDPVEQVAGGDGYIYPADNIKVTRRYYQFHVHSDEAIFVSTDVGRNIRMRYGTHIIFCTILGQDSANPTTDVTVEMSSPIPRDFEAEEGDIFNNGVTAGYSLGAWHAGLTNGVPNWPQIVFFHDGRLGFANTSGRPTTFWLSVVDDYSNFSETEEDGGVLDDSAISVTLTSKEVNDIKWAESGDVLLIGTTDGEWQVSAGTTVREPLTAAGIRISRQTDWGGFSGETSTRIGSGTMFLDRTGRFLRELVYSFTDDQWVDTDTTIVAEHILRDGGTRAKAVVLQKTPNAMLFVLREDGKVAVLTYNKKQEIAAWSLLELGGPQAFCDSVAITPSPDGTQDRVYFVVSRFIAGLGLVRNIEYLNNEWFSNGSDMEGAVFADAAVTVRMSGSSTTQGFALDHLEGEEVEVFMVDEQRALESTYTVGASVSGQIDISPETPTGDIVVGLAMETKIRTLPLGPQGVKGHGYMKTKRIHKSNIRFLDSMMVNTTGVTNMQFLGGKAGYSDQALFTGIHEIHPSTTFDGDAEFEITLSKAVPLTILFIDFELNVNE